MTNLTEKERAAVRLEFGLEEDWNRSYLMFTHNELRRGRVREFARRGVRRMRRWLNGHPELIEEAKESLRVEEGVWPETKQSQNSTLEDDKYWVSHEHLLAKERRCQRLRIRRENASWRYSRESVALLRPQPNYVSSNWIPPRLVPKIEGKETRYPREQLAEIQKDLVQHGFVKIDIGTFQKVSENVITIAQTCDSVYQLDEIVLVVKKEKRAAITLQ